MTDRIYTADGRKVELSAYRGSVVLRILTVAGGVLTHLRLAPPQARDLADALREVANECAPNEPTKYCPGCKENKVRSAFYAEPGRPDGYSSYCRACKRARYYGKKGA